MDWRLRLNAVLSPLLLREDGARSGDKVVATEDLYNPETQELLFKRDGVYTIKYLYPSDAPEGFILNSLQGDWFVGFDPTYGGADHFRVADDWEEEAVTIEDKLGELGSVPYDIMTILNQYRTASRTGIINELIARYGITNKQKKVELNKAVTKALSLLLDTGKLEPGKKVGWYKLSPIGKVEMSE
jgi:hypothetical protein